MAEPEVPVIEPTADDDGPASLFGKKDEPKPEVKAEEPKPEQVEEKPPETAPEPEKPQEEVKPPVDDDPVLEVAGISRRKSEWLKREQDAETWRNQSSHFQQKYMEVLEQGKQAPKQAAPPQAPQAPQYTIDEWKKEMDHNVENMVAAGIIEKDSVDVSPDLARGFAALYQEALQLRAFRQQAEQIYAQQVQPLVQSMEQGRAQSHRQAIIGDLNAKIDNVASLGEYFSPLANPDTRNTFITYLSEKVNPEIARLQAPDVVEFLASQYVAMTRDPLLKSIEQMARARNVVPAPNVIQTQGEGSPGASAPRKTTPKKNQDIHDLFHGE